jgi:hypothetical protein
LKPPHSTSIATGRYPRKRRSINGAAAAGVAVGSLPGAAGSAGDAVTGRGSLMV